MRKEQTDLWKLCQMRNIQHTKKKQTQDNTMQNVLSEHSFYAFTVLRKHSKQNIKNYPPKFYGNKTGMQPEYNEES